MLEMRWLLKELRPFLRVHLGSLACVLVASLLSLCDPLIMKWLIDVVLPSRRVYLLIVAAAGLLATYAGTIALGSLSSLLIYQTVQRMVFRIRVNLLDHLHRLSAVYHENTPVGETLFRLEQDVNKVGELGGDFVPVALRILVMGILMLAIMLTLNWRLTCVVAPVVPAFILLRHYYGQRLKASADSAQAQLSRVSSFLQEHLSSIPQIQLLCGERDEAARFAERATEALGAQVKRRTSEIQFGYGTLIVIYIGTCFVLGLGGYDVMRGSLTVGGLVAFYSYTLRLMEPMASGIQVYSRLLSVGASIRRILEVKAQESSVMERPGAVLLGPTCRGAVSLKGIRFGYQDYCPALREISFHVSPGEKVAIVGPSGSGKTTIARLIARQFDVWGGSIEIDGHDIRSLQIKSLRTTACLVTQDTVLFDASFRENILYGNPAASPAAVENAAKIAQLLDVVDCLPNGWDEQLGPRGIRLSGGERQRIALARALLRDPRILILDEATSALDAPTERRVLDALYTFTTGRTVIVIAHGLATVLWADRILVLDRGQIVEEGTHDRLYRRMGVYRRLCEEVLEKTAPAGDAGISVEGASR